MRTILRFSAATAFSRDPRQRWRQICIISSSALSTFLILVAVGLVMLSIASPARAGSLLGIATQAEEGLWPGSSPEGAVTAVTSTFTLAMGRQVPTIWIEPMPGHEEDAAAVPPGLSRLPQPGEAVLSPALITAGYSAEDFGWLSSSAGTGRDGSIGDEGLAAASEPLIFVRPAAGTSLGTGGAVTYIATYTASDPRAIHGGHALDPEVISLEMMLPGVVVFLLVPSLVLLVSSSRARSLLRDQRLQLLHLIGVRVSAARTALALEAALLAASGALLAAAGHALFGRWLTVIPGTSIRLLRGDLLVPWWVYPPALALVILCTLACGALGRLHRRPARGRPRSGWNTAVLGLAASVLAVLFSASPWTPPSSATTILTVGIFGVVVVIPFAVPALSRLAAALLSGTGSPVLWAAARRIRHDAVRLSRIASVLAMLIVVMSLALSLWGSAAATQAESPPAQIGRPVSASWLGDPTTGLNSAREAFAREDREVLLVSTISQDDSIAPEPLPRLLDIDDCPRFVGFFGGDAARLCTPEHEDQLSDFAELHTGLRPPDESSQPLPPSEYGDDALIYSRDPLSTYDAQRILGFLPAVIVESQPGDLRAPLPIVQWLMAGALAALVILGLAIAREIGDRSVDDSTRDVLYQRLGLSLGTAERLAWATLLIPLAVATLTAFVCSLVIAYSGQVLQVTRGDTLKLLIVAAVSLAIPVCAILLTLPVRRAATAMTRR